MILDCTLRGGPGSSREFTSLAGMLNLELDRAPIAECGMEPCRVVDPVDEVREVGDHVSEAFLLRLVDSLDLERLHEALGLGIVVGVAAPPHRAS